MNRITRNADFIEYFVEGGRDQKKCNNLHIDGNRLYNYNTVLLEFDGGNIYFNKTKYSVTTSKIQTYIKRELGYVSYLYNIIELDDVRINTQYLKESY